MRFTSPHPKDMNTEVYEVMASTPSVMPHLHFPLQSGIGQRLESDASGLHRRPAISPSCPKRDGSIPDLAVTTDIIVGFPGETEEDFQRTLEVAAGAEFDSAFTFVYSPRPGTEAADLTDRFCDPEEVKDRYSRLRTVIERSALKRHRAREGMVEEVVVEGPSKTDPLRLTGRTGQNKLVHFPKPEGPLRPGSYATVRVLEGRTQYLMGELVEVTARATHRTRLAVL